MGDLGDRHADSDRRGRCLCFTGRLGDPISEPRLAGPGRSDLPGFIPPTVESYPRMIGLQGYAKNGKREAAEQKPPGSWQRGVSDDQGCPPSLSPWRIGPQAET